MNGVTQNSRLLEQHPGAGAPSVIKIRPRKGLSALDLGDVWRYRELLYFLVWRDVKVRYAQAAIGTAWAVLQPLLTMVVFTIIFGRYARMPSDGLPYPIFAYAALVPWNYFAQAITRSGTSLTVHSSLISKVYFPRLIIPFSAALSPLVDFVIAFAVLLGMMVWYGIAPTWGVLMLPLFMLLAMLTATAVCLFLSALNVQYRDVTHAIPFLVQFWMYASPVVYPASIITNNRVRLLYGLNPMVGVIEGFRWALLGQTRPDFANMAVGGVVVGALLVAGLIYFKRMERTFADVI
jgi:lipopolysaccharide transport system permease protein